MNQIASVEDKQFKVHIEGQGEITVDGQRHMASIEKIDAPSLYSLIVDSSSYEIHVEEREGSYRVLLLGELYTVQLEDEAARRVAKARARRPLEEGEIKVKSPIPGLIFDVPVAAGQKVQVGDILVIVEAMKMENELRAPREGTVKITHVAPGDSVDKGTVLVTLA